MPRHWFQMLFLFISVTCGMPCHAIDHQVIYCECYGFEREFFALRCILPYTPSYFLSLFHAVVQNTVPACRSGVDVANET